MVYLKYVENVIPLSKLIGLLFLFCLPLLSILFLKTKRNDLARPVMGTIFLVVNTMHAQVTIGNVLGTQFTKNCSDGLLLKNKLPSARRRATLYQII